MIPDSTSTALMSIEKEESLISFTDGKSSSADDIHSVTRICKVDGCYGITIREHRP